MKKSILILIVILCSSSILFAQKKKINKSGNSTSAFLAKVENVSAEMIKRKLYVIRANSASKKDSILLKTYIEINKPNELKITPFTTNGIKLFLISWKENAVTTTNLKTEDAVIIFSEIVNFDTKSKVFSNTQTTTNVKEIHYLDTKQTVSETLQKVRKEGFEFHLNPDGEIFLKNKSQENRLIYNSNKNSFVAKK